MHISEHLNNKAEQTHPAGVRNANDLWTMSNALDQTRLVVVISDTSSVIQYVNQGFMRMMGYTSDAVIGRNIADFNNQLSEDGGELHDTLVSGWTWRNEYPAVRKDGSTIWIYNVVTPIIDDSGVITHHVGIGEDISHLFEHFHRGRNASSYTENGFGLAIVQAIVVAHRGEVVADNTEQSARFTLTLRIMDSMN